VSWPHSLADETLSASARAKHVAALTLPLVGWRASAPQETNAWCSGAANKLLNEGTAIGRSDACCIAVLRGQSDSLRAKSIPVAETVFAPVHRLHRHSRGPPRSLFTTPDISITGVFANCGFCFTWLHTE